MAERDSDSDHNNLNQNSNDIKTEKYFELLYPELKRLASRLGANHADYTGGSSPTLVVNECYLKFQKGQEKHWRDKRQFFAYASKVMRHILIDQARSYLSLKNSLGQLKTLENADENAVQPEMLISLDQCLDRLAEIEPRQAEVVSLKFFMGCTMDEIAELLDISRMTAHRDWEAAKQWLGEHS